MGNKPILDARHLDGNVFVIAGAVRQTLRRAGDTVNAGRVTELMTTSKSYEEALARFADLVDFDFGGNSNDDMEDSND
jgi:hypothetical protein